MFITFFTRQQCIDQTQPIYFQTVHHIHHKTKTMHKPNNSLNRISLQLFHYKIHKTFHIDLFFKFIFELFSYNPRIQVHAALLLSNNFLIRKNHWNEFQTIKKIFFNAFLIRKIILNEFLTSRKIFLNAFLIRKIILNEFLTSRKIFFNAFLIRKIILNEFLTSRKIFFNAFPGQKNEKILI